MYDVHRQNAKKLFPSILNHQLFKNTGREKYTQNPTEILSARLQGAEAPLGKDKLANPGYQ